MDPHLDTSWCPVCDRQILPKRFLVPANPAPPPPPPSSPQSSPSKNVCAAPTVRRKNGGTIRARGGLVHGTGRVKPNGHLKRSDSGAKSATPTPVAPPAPVAPVKLRTVIDQGPIPLYCSDECQMADVNNVCGAISPDYDPHCAPLSTRKPFSGPGAPHSESESDSTSSSSVDSPSSFTPKTTPMSPSIATLASIYNFPPLPPPAPVFDDNTSSSDSEYPEYNNGIMMASRRIEAALCPLPPSRSPYDLPLPLPTEPRKPIPGWTDGSNAWRSAVYSFSPPTHCSSVDSDTSSKFVASPHRSHGVNSTLGERPASKRTSSSTTSLPTARALETKELYSKYSDSLSRRSESRTSVQSAASSYTSQSPHRRERSLLPPGAEGKLLVPNVKMRPYGASSASLSTLGRGSERGFRNTTSSRSPRRHDNSSDEESGLDVLPSMRNTKRPTAETRSWSYDNLKTYPVMQLPRKKEKRLEKQVIDGDEVEVEVEVDVMPQMKRLFLFADKQIR